MSPLCLVATTLPSTRIHSSYATLCLSVSSGWNNVNKRYLRFGRGDPFLRFGRSQTLSAVRNLGYRFGKRSADDDALDTYLENGGYLRFGRSVPQSPLLSLLADGAHLRKRRDVSGETPEMQR